MAKTVRTISYLNKEHGMALSIDQSLAFVCSNKISENLTVKKRLRQIL